MSKPHLSDSQEVALCIAAQVKEEALVAGPYDLASSVCLGDGPGPTTVRLPATAACKTTRCVAAGLQLKISVVITLVPQLLACNSKFQ